MQPHEFAKAFFFLPHYPLLGSSSWSLPVWEDHLFDYVWVCVLGGLWTSLSPLSLQLILCPQCRGTIQCTLKSRAVGAHIQGVPRPLFYSVPFSDQTDIFKCFHLRGDSGLGVRVRVVGGKRKGRWN